MTLRPNFLSPSSRMRAALVASGLLSFALGLSACGAKQAPTEAPEPAPALTTSELPERCARETCINDNVDVFDVDGIRVIVKHIDTPPLVVAEIYVNGGALHWTPETSGHAALALHTAASDGPATMTRHDYQRTLEHLAASIQTFVSADTISAMLHAPGFAIEETFGLMSDVLTQPALRDQELEIARSKQLASIQSRYDGADNAVSETVRELAWAGHPYAVHPGGEVETIADVTKDELRAAIDALLVREKMTVVFVGDISNAQARTLVETHLAEVPSDPEWAAALNFPDAFEPFSYESGDVRVLARPGIPTNYILGYYAAPPLGHEDYAPMVLATSILRDKLFEEVRTRRNLSYAVSAAVASRRSNTGMLYVTATKPSETIQVMYDTIDAMIDEGVTEKEVENELRKYLTRYYMDLQSYSSLADILGSWALATGDPVDVDRFVDDLRAVTPARISEVLNTYIRNIQFGILGDPEQIDEEVFRAR